MPSNLLTHSDKNNILILIGYLSLFINNNQQFVCFCCLFVFMKECLNKMLTNFLVITGSNNPHYCAFVTKIFNLTGLSDSASVTAIHTDNLVGLENPQISLTIPINLLRTFDKDNDEIVKVASAIFRNISSTFISGLHDEK